MMILRKYQSINNDSLIKLWKSLLMYQETLLSLWQKMIDSEILNQLVLTYIERALDYFHQFVNIIYFRYELTDWTTLPPELNTLIDETKEFLFTIYHFSQQCPISLYSIRKLNSLQCSLLLVFDLLTQLLQQKQENNTETIWLATHVFNPNNKSKKSNTPFY